MIHIRRLQADNFKQLEGVDLALPRRARVLVQGPNEAGKSTLFEAIYVALFGRPLAAETGHARLDDVVAYGTEEAWLRLDVTLPGGREMHVVRRIRRGKANRWELDLVGDDGALEEVRGNRVVNERIEAELGFDGEALLNTCFVEQKKLEKLEGMSRAQREQSLMKLLNLDRLLEVEDELRVRPGDRADLERLADRAALARRQAELPEVTARLEAVAGALARHEALEALERAAAAGDDLAQRTAALAEARAREAARAERAQAAERARAGLGKVAEGRAALERGSEAREAARGVRGRLDAARAAAGSRQDEVVARGTALRRLRARLAWLEARRAERAATETWLADTDARLAGAAAAREALNELRRDLVEARAAAREAATTIDAESQTLRAFDVRAALADWLDARTAARGTGNGAEAVEQARAAHEAARRRAGRVPALLALSAAALAALALALALLGGGVAAAVALGAAVLAGLGATRAWVVGARRVDALARRLGRLEGEADLRAREAEALAAREAAAAERVAAQNAVLPAGRGRAREALDELDARLDGRDRAAVEAALAAAREAGATAQAGAAALEAREADLRASAGRVDAGALGAERDARAAHAAKLARVIERREARIEALAASLGVPPDAAAVERELGDLRGELRRLRELAATVPDLAAEAARLEAAAASHRAAAAAAWRALPEPARTDGGRDGDGGPPAGEGAEGATDLPEAAWSDAEAALRAAFEAAGGDAAARALAEATRAAGEIEGRRQAAARARGEALARLRASLAAAGVEAAVADDPSPDDLAAVRAAARPADGADADALREDHARLTERVNVVRHEIDRLSRELGLPGERLDVGATERAHDEAARDMAVRERAASIVQQAGRGVVQRILPSTIEHMRAVLPLLTDGRYFDAQLSDDYRIEVFDDRAKAWKKKNIFSGGTRDQLSLALRLAFALATLPEERGTAPSFLFLDEPLGAFDDARAGALIHLLTEGAIATAFDQIFLISHVRVDPELFDHRVVLDAGRVVETDLPPADPEDAAPHADA